LEGSTKDKRIVNVFDLGYLGLENDYQGQLSSLPNRKKTNLLQLSQEQKKNTTKAILKRELWLSILSANWKNIRYLQMYLETN